MILNIMLKIIYTLNISTFRKDIHTLEAITVRMISGLVQFFLSLFFKSTLIWGK